MIDVSPYIEKLEKLKKYIGLKIDNMGAVLQVDHSVLPTLSIEQMLELAMEKNIFWYEPINDNFMPKKLTFEEWLKFQHSYQGCQYTEWKVKNHYYLQSDLN